MQAPRNTSFAHAPRAFTLVEVLMGVLILSLALLGLAAVFPVVAREQRLARESIAGGSTMNSVDSFIQTSDIFNRPVENTKHFGWDLLLNDANWSKELKYPAIANKTAARYYTPWVGTAYNADGSSQFTCANGTVRIPLAARLWPQRVSNEDTPLFVWDLVARRISGRDENRVDDDESVQAVVFLRRVDPSIRVPQGSSVRNELVSGNAAAIAVDATGVPRLDGRGAYAQIGVIKVSAKKIDPNKIPTSWVVLKLAKADGLSWSGISAYPGTMDPLPLAMQVGQKLVDRFGTVYTVTRAGPLDPKFDTAAVAGIEYVPKAFEVIISPGLTPQAVQALETSDNELYMLFSPQIPVDVLVREYRR